MSAPFLYAERLPPASLRAFASVVWTFSASEDVAPGTFTLPPDPCLSVALAGRADDLRVRIVGPHLRPLAVPTGPGAVVRGVRLRPEAAGPLLDLDTGAWRDRLGDAASHLPDLDVAHADPEAVWPALLDRLAARAAQAPEPDALVRRAVIEIEAAGGDLRVGALADRLGVGVRTLQRRFVRATGLPPKTFARVRRFLKAVGGNVLRPDPEAWSRVALDHGYADQAHFARESVALTGLSPTAYAERLGYIRHDGVRP